jgi:hypothetical protein
MFDDMTIAQQEGRNEDPGSSNWRRSKCRTELRGTPRQRLLDGRDRRRRDWCRSCERTTVMERG